MKTEQKNHPGFLFAVNTSGSKSQELEYVKAMLGEVGAIKQVEGCWCESRETSYVVFPSKPSNYNVLKESVINLARLHSQQCVIALGFREYNGRSAELYWLLPASTRIQDAGRFVAVSPTEAMMADGWTRDGSQFYILK